MDKLEKVIKGMKCCGGVSSVYECPYQGSEGCDNCQGNVFLDALSLLKKQEPIEPIKTKYFTTLCGQCRHEIDKLAGDKFCPHCGRAVKWE
jgi:ribosomal protein L33